MVAKNVKWCYCHWSSESLPIWFSQHFKSFLFARCLLFVLQRVCLFCFRAHSSLAYLFRTDHLYQFTLLALAFSRYIKKYYHDFVFCDYLFTQYLPLWKFSVRSVPTFTLKYEYRSRLHRQALAIALKEIVWLVVFTFSYISS